MSRLFRKKFLALLRQAFDRGELRLLGRIRHLADRPAWRKFVGKLDEKDWVVYAKPPFGGPKQVLMYLARYTHRVAISNQRILRLEDGKVAFRWKDYRRGHRPRVMTLTAVEFLRRFLLHVLPRGFQRIRYYGLLANRVRTERLELCRRLLHQQTEKSTHGEHAPAEPLDSDSLGRCPCCDRGRMCFVCELKPDRNFAAAVLAVPILDTS